MKIFLSSHDIKRNDEFNKLILSGDFKQNCNDYQHRQLNDHFLYKLIDTESGRKQFCRNFNLKM